MKQKYILISLVLCAQLSIVAQDGNAKKQTDKKNSPKKEAVVQEGKRITSKDKVAENEALNKAKLNAKKTDPNTKVESESK